MNYQTVRSAKGKDRNFESKKENFNRFLAKSYLFLLKLDLKY